MFSLTFVWCIEGEGFTGCSKRIHECTHEVKGDTFIAKAIRITALLAEGGLGFKIRQVSVLHYVNIFFSFQTRQGYLDWFCYAYWTGALKSNLRVFFLICSTAGDLDLIRAKNQISAWYLASESETEQKILVILYPVSIYVYHLNLHGWGASLKATAKKKKECYTSQCYYHVTGL